MTNQSTLAIAEKILTIMEQDPGNAWTRETLHPYLNPGAEVSLEEIRKALEFLETQGRIARCACPPELMPPAYRLAPDRQKETR